MPDTAVHLSDFGTASIQVTQLFQNICVRYLSMHFMKPLDLLHLEKKSQGAPRRPTQRLVLYFSPQALLEELHQARPSSAEGSCSLWRGAVSLLAVLIYLFFYHFSVT